MIEEMRQKMLKNPYFDITKTYREMDSDEKGSIVAEDVSTKLLF